MSNDFTIEEYNTLNRAIAQGALKVKYGDKEVEYRSLDEMVRLRNIMRKELGLNRGKSHRKVAVYYKT